MPRHHGPRFPMGAVFAGTVFAVAVVGFFWVGTLVGVGAGLHPLAEAAPRLSEAVRSVGAR